LIRPVLWVNAEDAEGDEETEGDEGKDRKAGRRLTLRTRGRREEGRGAKWSKLEMVKWSNRSG
jgi:hypothetical protein